MEDYTKLERYGQAICPHCGKILKGRGRTVACGGLGDWDADYTEYETYYTFNCKDCGIKINTANGDLDEISAYKFPKDYKPTVTKAQLGYIKFLANKYFLLVPYTPVITNKEVAKDWISQFDKIYREDIRKELYEQKIKELFKKQGFGLASSNKETVLGFHKQFNMAPHTNVRYIGIYVYFDIESKNILLDLNIQDIAGLCANFANTLNNLDEQITMLRKQVKEVLMPTDEEVEAEINTLKNNYKRYCAHRYDDYDYDSFDGPWFNAFGVE